MAYNLSSNQQYLLSLVQQNNPEILSKFLNEVTQEEKAKSEAAKQDPLGAVQMARVRKGIITGTDEQQALLKYSDDKETERQAKAAEHYQDLFASIPPNPSEMTPQQAAEVAMYKVMKDKKYGKTAEKLKSAVETKTSGVSQTLTQVNDDTLRSLSMPADDTRVPSTQNKVALRYLKKYEENQLPFEDRPISPFYKTTRKEFQAQFGRDFDALGGATPANMRGLVNIKTNLAGRLKDIETGWQDKMSWEKQLAAAGKYKNPFAKMAASLVAKGEAEKENPVYNYIPSDFDVPEVGNPGEPEGMERTLPTKPVDTGRKTEWLFSGIGEPLAGDKQASNLSGKSINQKINRIA
jgi:hypothetical protein